jgi:HEAT repeat protein
LNISDEHFDSLVQTLFTAPGMLTRSIAALDLGNSRDPRAIEPLRKCLDETDREILSSAIQALSELEDHASIPRFLSFLDASHDKWVRVKAIHALCVLCYSDARLQIREMLHDPDDIVRREAMLGLLVLSQSKGPEVKADLMAFLSDSYEPNRHLAQESLKVIEMAAAEAGS